MLYRVFPLAPGTPRPDPFDVPRALQGQSRHDNPDHYTALYCAREAVSAVAERIQGFRGRMLTPGIFRRPDGTVLALATLEEQLDGIVDLDDPEVLARERVRPSRVATGDRSVTRALALRFFDAGVPGISWWSTLEAAWTNVTLYDVRLPANAVRVADVRPLDLDDELVRAAAERLGVGMPREHDGADDTPAGIVRLPVRRPRGGA